MIVSLSLVFFFFFNDTATTEIYTLSLHDALPICACTSITFARRPFTTTSRRRAWACAGAMPIRPHPTKTMPAIAPAASPRNSLRVVMVPSGGVTVRQAGAAYHVCRSRDRRRPRGRTPALGVGRGGPSRGPPRSPPLRPRRRPPRRAPEGKAHLPLLQPHPGPERLRRELRRRARPSS